MTDLEERLAALRLSNHNNYERAEERHKIIRDMYENNPGEYEIHWLRLGAEILKDILEAFKSNPAHLSDMMSIGEDWLEGR